MTLMHWQRIATQTMHCAGLVLEDKLLLLPNRYWNQRFKTIDFYQWTLIFIKNVIHKAVDTLEKYPPNSAVPNMNKLPTHW